MRIITCILLLLLFRLSSVAQEYHGKVIDSKSQPISNASVIMLNGKGKTIAFTKSTANGGYMISAPEEKGGKYLTFVCMGYDRDTISLEGFKQGQATILYEKAFEIREVKVTAPQIRQRGDTLDYIVNMFKQKQDRTIEDVLKKMPGISVNEDGSIEVGGQKINKLYIEGMDLLGNKYAEATQNISVGKVKKVQVLNNHQPVKMLRNSTFSDQAALNIVLADDAKEVWQAAADLGAGLALQKPTDGLGNARLTAMRFGHQSQSISMYKFNNTGKDILHEININQLLGLTAPEESGVLSNINLGQPDLKRERTSFNCSHLFATNWLFKLRKDSELRFQLSGALDKSKQRQTTTTIYQDVPGNATIAEDVSAHSYESVVNADMSYKVNSDKTFLVNNLSGYMDWNRSTGVSVLNDNTVRENVKPHKRYISDDFRWIYKLSDKRNIALTGYVAYNDLPGHLLLNDGSWEELHLQTFRWKLNSWLSHRYGKVNVTYDINAHGTAQWLSTVNRVDTASNRYCESWVTGKATAAYKNDAFSFSVEMPLSWLNRRFQGKDKQDLLFTPNATAEWSPSNSWSFKVRYGYSWQPMQLTQITSLSYFSSYLSLTQGLGYLDNTHGQNLSATINYRNVGSGFFATSLTTWSNTSGNVLYCADYVDGFYTTRPTDLRSDGRFLMSMLQLTKSFHWSHLSISLQGNYTQSDYKMLLNDVVTPFQLKGASAKWSLSLQPASWFSFSYNGDLGCSKQINRADNLLHSPSLVSFSHQLKTFFMPGKWQVEWAQELYHSNSHATSTNYFMDLSVSYRQKHYEIGLSLSNILGTKTYQQHYYTTSQQIFQVNYLRPREIMANVSFDF